MVLVGASCTGQMGNTALIGTLVLWSITSFILYTRNSFLFKLLLPLFLQQLVLSSYAYSSLKIAFKYHLSTILNQINYIICVWYPQRTIRPLSTINFLCINIAELAIFPRPPRPQLFHIQPQEKESIKCSHDAK